MRQITINIPEQNSYLQAWTTRGPGSFQRRESKSKHKSINVLGKGFYIKNQGNWIMERKRSSGFRRIFTVAFVNVNDSPAGLEPTAGARNR